jgi:hypothetical protein
MAQGNTHPRRDQLAVALTGATVSNARGAKAKEAGFSLHLAKACRRAREARQKLVETFRARKQGACETREERADHGALGLRPHQRARPALCGFRAALQLDARLLSTFSILVPDG